MVADWARRRLSGNIFVSKIFRKYYFPKNAFALIKELKFSERGELEVVDLINQYINHDLCNLVLSNSQSDYWMDTGTNDSLIKATNFIRDLKIASGNEIAQFSLKKFNHE